MQTEHTEGQGQFRLRNRGDVLEKLSLMLRKRCVLRAELQGLSSPFVTTLLAVLPEQNLLRYRASGHHELNRLLLEKERIVFSTRVGGILCRFAVEHPVQTELEGRQVLGTAFPDSLFWLQQRNYFRVVVPSTMPVRCLVSMRGEPVEFPVVDLSIAGVALYDDLMRFDDAYGPGFRFSTCILVLPEGGEVRTGIEIRNKIIPAGSRRTSGQRIGCSLFGMTRHAIVTLQRFVFAIELLDKRDTL